MKNEALIIASIMPEEVILDMLSEALTEHKITKTDESKGKLMGACVMLMAKEAITKEPGGVFGVMKEMDTLERGKNLLTPKLS